jgi:hypothetical protein
VTRKLSGVFVRFRARFLRYVTYFDNEYYLDEKTHYLDLVIILLKEELYSRLHEDKTKIEANKTIIKGWLSSNKVEINFKE